MQRAGWWVLLLIAAVGALVRLGGQNGDSRFVSRPERLQAAYARLPLSFEENRGQFDRSVRFLARGSGYSLAVSAGETLVLLSSPRRHGVHTEKGRRRAGERKSGGRGRAQPVVSGQWPVVGNPLTTHHSPLTTHHSPGAPNAVLRMRLLRRNPQARVTGLDPLPGKVNYLLGNDPSKWRRNVPTCGRVLCGQVYPGIDLVYYGDGGHLEYDFIVAPGADPRRIRFGIEGARKVELDPRGDLVLRTAGGDVVQHAPVVYQEIHGRRQPIAGGYVLKAEGPPKVEGGRMKDEAEPPDGSKSRSKSRPGRDRSPAAGSGRRRRGRRTG